MGIERFKRLFFLAKRLYGKYGLQVFLLIGLSILNGFVGSLGISTLIPLFSYVVKGSIEGSDPISKGFRAVFQYLGFSPSLKVLLITVTSLFILKSIVLIIFSYVKIAVSTSYELSARKALYAKTLKAKWEFLATHKLGYLEGVLMGDLGTAGSFLKAICCWCTS